MMTTYAERRYRLDTAQSILTVAGENLFHDFLQKTLLGAELKDVLLDATMRAVSVTQTWSSPRIRRITHIERNVSVDELAFVWRERSEQNVSLVHAYSPISWAIL